MVVSITYEQECTQLTWYLRSGEKAVLGNSPWCDFVLPSFTEEPRVCCTLHLEHILLVEADLDTDLRNLNKKTNSIAIQTSDSFHLQNYPIVVTFLTPSHHPAQADAGKASDHPSLSPADAVCDDDSQLWFNYASVPQQVLMSEMATSLFLSVEHPQIAIDKLVSQDLLEDAVRGLAGMLPLKQLIDWCIDMLDTSGINIEPNTRMRLRQWQSDPMSVSRREISAIVNWNDNSNPWTHLLAAVSWVEPNADSSKSWCAAPTLSMIVASVIASLQLATASVKAEPFRRICIEKGLKLLQSSLSEPTTGGSV
ncbi:MAG: DUF6931 family protein [Pirellula sp.]|jgi:hypothetical protein